MTWFDRRKRCKCTSELEAIAEAVVGLTLTVNKRLKEIVEALESGAATASLRLSAGPELPKEAPMFAVESTREGKKLITISPVSIHGTPTEVDGPVSIEVLSGSSTHAAGADDSHFYVVSADTPGVTIYLLKADADLGEGVVEIQETIEYTVTDVRAAALGLSAGPEEPK